MFNGGTRKRMLTSSSMESSTPSSLSYSPLPSPTKQVKLETPDAKQHEVSSACTAFSYSTLYHLRPSQVWETQKNDQEAISGQDSNRPTTISSGRGVLSRSYLQTPRKQT